MMGVVMRGHVLARFSYASLKDPQQTNRADPQLAAQSERTRVVYLGESVRAEMTVDVVSDVRNSGRL